MTSIRDLALSAVLSLAAASGAAAQAYKGPVAVVVSIPVPAGLTRAAVEAQFAKLAPTYRAIPTLKQKYFTINDDTHRAGGIYLWADRAAAQAFYSDVWRASVLKAYGAPADLTWFDAPLVIQGGAGMNDAGR